MSRVSRIAAASLSAWLTIVAAACEEEYACPPVGYNDHLAITIESRSWADGRYELELDDRLVCSVEVREQGASWSKPSEDATCVQTGAVDSGGERIPSFTVAADVQLTLLETPERVHLAITRDGQLLDEREHALAYWQTLPYGKGCGGPRVAELRVTVP